MPVRPHTAGAEGANGARPPVAYYRVSTASQGTSGLGIDAQRSAVAKYAATAGAVLTREFTEAESGKRSDRACRN